jgi:hypothetical protein
VISQTLAYLTDALLVYWQSGFWTLPFAAASATALMYGKPSITALPTGLYWCVTTFFCVLLSYSLLEPLLPFIPHSPDLNNSFAGGTHFICLVQWCTAFIGPFSVFYLFAGLIYYLSAYFLAEILGHKIEVYKTIVAAFGDVSPLGTLYVLHVILWYTATVLLLTLRDAAKETYMALEDKPFVMNIVSMIVILVLLFAGFYILNDIFKMIVWFLFLLIAYPVVLAFTISLARGDAVFTDKGLGDLYHEGLTQVPIIGKLIGGSDEKSPPPDNLPKP